MVPALLSPKDLTDLRFSIVIGVRGTGQRVSKVMAFSASSSPSNEFLDPVHISLLVYSREFHTQWHPTLPVGLLTY